MGAHSHWLYWFWNTAKKSSLYEISLLLVQILHCTDYSQWQYIFQLSTPILTDTCLSILVGNYVYFTVLCCTEHSHTTVGNVTLHLTVSNAEFRSKFSRTYKQIQKFDLNLQIGSSNPISKSDLQIRSSYPISKSDLQNGSYNWISKPDLHGSNHPFPCPFVNQFESSFRFSEVLSFTN